MDLKPYIGLLVGQQQTPEQISRQLLTTPATDRYLDKCIHAAVTAHQPQVKKAVAWITTPVKEILPKQPRG
jgi:hypothetical protein